MKLDLAMSILCQARTNQIVISTMSAAGAWQHLTDSPLDFTYIPSSMGQGAALAFGLALAIPSRPVLALIGDGSLLMNPGCLVTIADWQVNLHVILIENGHYEVTGGQRLAGSARVDYQQLAEASGIQHRHRFEESADWQQHVAAIIHGPGPSFTVLKIDGQQQQKTPTPKRGMAEQVRRLRMELGVDQAPI